MFAILGLVLLSLGVFALLAVFHFVRADCTWVTLAGLVLFICLIASSYCFAHAGIQKGHADGYKQGQIDAKNGIWKVEWTMTGTWTTTQPLEKE